MESQPQNPEFRINPENFHPCNMVASHGLKINVDPDQKALSEVTLYSKKGIKV